MSTDLLTRPSDVDTDTDQIEHDWCHCAVVAVLRWRLVGGDLPRPVCGAELDREEIRGQQETDEVNCPLCLLTERCPRCGCPTRGAC